MILGYRPCGSLLDRLYRMNHGLVIYKLGKLGVRKIGPYTFYKPFPGFQKGHFMTVTQRKGYEYG